MPHDCPWLCSIDFGFDTTVVAVRSRETGGAVVLEREGATTVPSAVFAATAEKVYTGELALTELEHEPSAGLYSPKKLIADGGAGRLVAENGDTVSATELVAEVLRPAYRDAAALFVGPPDAVILTHPAGWADDGPAMQAFRSAAVEAGIPAELMQTVSEPLAVAHHAQLSSPEDGCVVAVLDIGAGTVDVAVLDVSEGAFQARPLAPGSVSAPIGMRLADRVLTEELIELIDRDDSDSAEQLRATISDRAERTDLPSDAKAVQAAMQWRAVAAEVEAQARELKHNDRFEALIPLSFARPLRMTVQIDPSSLVQALSAVAHPAVDLKTTVDLDEADRVVLSGQPRSIPCSSNC